MLRVQKSGFDLVELHGGTGCLLAQFVSPRTNKRGDRYGGDIQNRIMFSLEVLKRVKDMVGDFPVGYGFLADEWLPDGLHVHDSAVLAKALEEAGVGYLSVMGGTYESFFLPETIKQSRKPGYMVSLAEAIKKVVRVPVCSWPNFNAWPGRTHIEGQKGRPHIFRAGTHALGDAEWPWKAREGQDRSMLKCSPKCDACLQSVMQGKPAFCPRWKKEKREKYRDVYR